MSTSRLSLTDDEYRALCDAECQLLSIKQDIANRLAHKHSIDWTKAFFAIEGLWKERLYARKSNKQESL